jgi:hypothetical protein
MNQEENMTENRTWTEEKILASDVWRVEKCITPLGDEEQLAKWEQAVAVLKDLGKLAETLWNDPLILALTDALVRAEEERARLEDRLSRTEGEQLASREDHRLKGLMRRADALGMAATAVEDDEGWNDAESRARTLKILEELRVEATEAFERYRSEVGVTG